MTATLTRKKARVNHALGIERARWAAYFDELSRHNDLWVTLEVEGEGGLGGRTDLRRVPLDSISFDDLKDRIVIGVGSDDERGLTGLCHYVDHPRLVHVALHDDDPVTLSIASNGGRRTVLRFFDAGA